jgi:hypothetical protein
MCARGACRAPLQLEWARVLVPLHPPVTRRSELTQTHSPPSSHHGASPAGRCLLVGGDFNCIAGQQDMAAGQPGQRTQGYWTGLRLVETEHQLYDVWRDLNPSSRAFTHVATTGQSAARLDRWLISKTLQARVSREPRAIGQVLGYPGDHLGVSLSLTAPASILYGSAASHYPLTGVLCVSQLSQVL